MPFSRSAHLYDDLYTPIRDYATQAKLVKEWITARKSDARTLLDVACGTGIHLSHLRKTYKVAGVDICPSMVALARPRNPAVPISIGDMRTFKLNTQFDVVTCLFSSITYADTVEGLNLTLANFAGHLHPGGVCIVEPFIPPESWRVKPPTVRTVETNSRKIVMVDRAKLHGRRVQREISYKVTTVERIECLHETHVFPLFTHVDYFRAFRQAGFDVEFDPRGFNDLRGMYLGIRTR
jgi:dTDP-3-amino-3,4,6-trideoxy-alpha-D-glucopyranose N,N-dimethyltransferase